MKELGGWVSRTSLLSKWTRRYLDDLGLEWSLMYVANLMLIRWKDEGLLRRLGYSMLDRVMFGKVESMGKFKYTGGL